MDLFADYMGDDGLGLQVPLQHVPGSSISLPQSSLQSHGQLPSEAPPPQHTQAHGQEEVSRSKSMREIAMRDKRTPKLRKSCELCRDSKGKCVVPKEGKGCLRCIKERKTCVFLEAKPRPKRAKNSRIRVAEMEEKLNGLMALLEANAQKVQNTKGPQIQNENMDSPNITPNNGHHTPSTTSTTHPASASSSANTPSQVEPATQPSISEHLDQICGFATSSNHQSQSQSQHQQQHPPSSLELHLAAPVHYSSSIFPFPNYFSNDINDCISKGIISFEDAEESLKYFRTKSHSFPFVLCPDEGMGLDGVRRDRPFLLLSILAFAQRRNKRVQEALERELKEQLSRSVIMVGERSLDVLQGLLVYLAWYHMFFQPGKHQMYQFCQMAAGMAVDLDINKADGDHNPLDMMTPLKSPKQPKTTLRDLEERRTFLGTYYMTAAYCQGLRRASPIPLNSYGEECCQVLAQVSVTETDYLIPYFIRLQKIADDINQTFDYDNHVSLPELDAHRIEILIKGFEERFKQIEATFPEEIWRNPAISLTYQSQKIYLHEIGFHASPPSPHPPLKPTASHSWYTSPLRTTHLLLSLQASKSFLDKILSLPTTQLEDFTLPGFIRLVYAVLIIGSLTMYFDAPGFDRGMARSVADVEIYLERLIAKMEEGVREVGVDGNMYMRHVSVLFGHYKSRFRGMGMREGDLQVGVRGWYSLGGVGIRGWDASTHPHVLGSGPGTAGLLSFADMMPPPGDCGLKGGPGGDGMGNHHTHTDPGVEMLGSWEGMLDSWEGGSLGEEVMRGLEGIS